MVYRTFRLTESLLHPGKEWPTVRKATLSTQYTEGRSCSGRSTRRLAGSPGLYAASALILISLFLVTLPLHAEPSPGDELNQALDELDSSSSTPATPTVSRNTRAQLIDLSLIGDFSAGVSSLEDEKIADIQGYLHDPRRKGFAVNSLEMSMSGAVDPYFFAEAHINLADGAEIEEAFMTSQALPFGLQLEMGQFLTEFGLLNPQHPHTWYWVDAPVSITRIMGNHGMISQGLRLGWLLPLPWFSQIHFGAQNADGEHMKSFLGMAGESGHNHGTTGAADLPIGGYEIAERDLKSSNGLAYLLRWENSLDLTESITAKFGFSGMTGPNATGPTGHTLIYGADLYVKWKPATNYRGFPYLIWQTEFMRRDYRVSKVPDIGKLSNTYALISGKYFDPYTAQETFTQTALENLLNDSVLSADQGNFGLAAQVLTGVTDFSSLTEEESKQAIEALTRIAHPEETLHDWGYYSQILLGFVRGWSAGLRYEFASGSGESRVAGGDWLEGQDLYGRDRDPYRDTRVRVSPLVIYQPTEFTRFRLQYNQEWSDHLRDRKVYVTTLDQINPSLPAVPYEFVLHDNGRAAWSVWIGAEFLIGYHPAHNF